MPEGGPATCDAMAPVTLWPHQRWVVAETASAWPAGRLLCDEVGMGKTVEAILALRRLLAGRGAKRALLLPPANLLQQWQGELREKGGIDEAEVRKAIVDIDPLWDELFPAEQTRIIQLLVQRVDVGVDGAAIRLRTSGIASLIADLRAVAAPRRAA